jgi:hypothetical protein
VWKKPWMSCNRDTYVDAVLRQCGAVNVCADQAQRYCRVSLDDVAQLAPDLVLLPDEPYPFSEKDIPDVGPLLWPRGAARAARVVDGRALSWYGSHTPVGLRVVRAAVSGS